MKTKSLITASEKVGLQINTIEKKYTRLDGQFYIKISYLVEGKNDYHCHWYEGDNGEANEVFIKHKKMTTNSEMVYFSCWFPKTIKACVKALIEI